MSGLAEILLNLGFSVSGSDMKPSNITSKLENKGVKINIGHSEENIGDADLVIYTAAVKSDNPELMKAKSLGIPTLDRATLLGEIMKKYPFSVAVSGTHGKTTTTSMISLIMLKSSLDLPFILAESWMLLGEIQG
ncbi:UDP-N-acetylmuramate-alanine ligase [Acetivibrio straminisolvens JCM 21531]|uniref:UDP-N-acetylmuramate-alanine ligase n=1 Tax=Acetivibrio straminisolvens JCM 21531 TaxID=1294263 RepID=W4V177_9FIRM|nr:UDP-N-acetylmuramate-alanine ligase [Acetivibrio straminisolvens JCM 21531]